MNNKYKIHVNSNDDLTQLKEKTIISYPKSHQFFYHFVKYIVKLQKL